jgi:hypothetical protein
MRRSLAIALVLIPLASLVALPCPARAQMSASGILEKANEVWQKVVDRTSRVAFADGRISGRDPVITSSPVVEPALGSEAIISDPNHIPSDIVGIFPVEGFEAGSQAVIIGGSVEQPVALPPPFVEALDPPVAPRSARPAECGIASRVPRKDLHSRSWKLSRPGTEIKLLPRRDTNEMAGEVEGPAPSTVNERKSTVGFTFDCPAHFPIMRFKDRFQSYEDEGLRIVEGMVLRFDQDGYYEVEFNAEGLSVPVTLRLQFSVRIGGCPGTLTLPPIVLDPRRSSQTVEVTNSWHIVTQGRLPLLCRALCTCSSIRIERDGTARFGSGINSAQAMPRLN